MNLMNLMNLMNPPSRFGEAGLINSPCSNTGETRYEA